MYQPRVGLLKNRKTSVTLSRQSDCIVSWLTIQLSVRIVWDSSSRHKIPSEKALSALMDFHRSSVHEYWVLRQMAARFELPRSSYMWKTTLPRTRFSLVPIQPMGLREIRVRIWALHVELTWYKSYSGKSIFIGRWSTNRVPRRMQFNFKIPVSSFVCGTTFLKI